MAWYPFNYCNRGGIPKIEVNTVTVSDNNVALTLPNNTFRFLASSGIILLRLNQPIPTGTTATLPVVLSVNEFTQALTNIGGTPITVAELPGAGVYVVYYDKDANLMQLLTSIIA